MTDLIEFDPADSVGAGAFGTPGQRTFLVQAVRGTDVLSVLVEKEQIRLLANEALQFLERLGADQPDPMGEAWGLDGSVREAVPLFRARMLGIGYDPRRSLVVIELREWPDDVVPSPEEPGEPNAASDPGLPEPRVARIFASRAQVRAMATHALEVVDAGRPPCPLCEMPIDPDGHWCPRWN